MASALETLAEEARLNTSMQIEVKSVGDTSLAQTVGAELLSVAREALSNVVRHADASHATLEITAANGEVRLEIADDGKGFDADAPGRGGYHGLANMRRRAESMGGRLLVESAPGRGTRIIVVLPLPE
jgi:signal transduction histidine kinase